jgi:nitrogenase molybdenum-iron protein alpha/beta subunit
MGVLRMKQVQRVLANYSADLFGLCSALYELGGLIVMHDASGCNSTYNTHDEPRWYDIDSMIYVSGLTEQDAILGNDAKIIGDILEAAEETHPKFIAVCGSPMPYLLGTDFRAIARILEKKSGIPSFGFRTDGMHTYIRGAGDAFAAVAERFCRKRNENPRTQEASGSGTERQKKLSVNLIGVTPLDFSIVGNAEAMRSFLAENGMSVQSCWAMGDTLENLSSAGDADLSIVVSTSGIAAAEVLKKRFGIPYVTGIPAGKAAAEQLLRDAAAALRIPEEPAETGKPEEILPVGKTGEAAGDIPDSRISGSGSGTVIIGEPVFANAVRTCLEQELGAENVRLICPTEITDGFLRPGDTATDEEEDFEKLLNQPGLTVIADPIYRRIIERKDVRFIDFPHEAYSGRLYRSGIPVFAGRGFSGWLREKFFSS